MTTWIRLSLIQCMCKASKLGFYKAQIGEIQAQELVVSRRACQDFQPWCRGGTVCKVDPEALPAQDHANSKDTGSGFGRISQKDAGGCIFGSYDNVPLGVDDCGLWQEALNLFKLFACLDYAWMLQRWLHWTMYLSSDACQSGSVDFWFAGTFFCHKDIQCNWRRYI